ncbi:MAG: phosphate/phosphite/phosphonate ABC transporter substrate-binding protein [Candidatus Rokubacteria bacterium]|nr:phosphate/phosphite/phosphonate ABC transporter substrate-binding protein [Candidatus Rokubacteria bacterium]
MLSPTRTLDAYHDLLIYMGQRLGRPVRLIQRPTYAEVNDLLKHHEIDVAFVCGGALPTGERDFGMTVLAVPEIRGKTVYHAYLIVNRRSGFESLGDLVARSFAFSDPLSTSGRVAAVYQLALRGQTPERFFSRTVFTHSHDNSILAVADGLVDGAVVGSHVYDYLRARDPDAIQQTRVIARWGPFGNPPVVVHPDLDPALHSALEGFLLSIHADSFGKRLLDRLLIDRFVEPSPDLFDSIREMEARVRRR